MNNGLTLFEGGSKLPAYLKNLEPDAITKALAGGTQGKRISIKGNVFRMIVNGEEKAVNEERQMNIVVVAAAPAVARTFYGEVYVEGESKSPTCWSPDGVTPHPTSLELQADKCASCKQNIAGSGNNDSRACRYSQRIAAVLDGDFGGAVYQLSLPAQSIFGKAEDGKMPLQAYAKHLSTHAVPITAVVTEIKFDIKSPTPKLFFKPIRALTEEEFETCRAQGATEDAKNAITMNVTQMDGGPKKAATPVEAAPKAVKTKPAVVAQVQEPEEEPEAPVVTEPVVKKAAKPEPVAPKKDVKDILRQWAATDDNDD